MNRRAFVSEQVVFGIGQLGWFGSSSVFGLALLVIGYWEEGKRVSGRLGRWLRGYWLLVIGYWEEGKREEVGSAFGLAVISYWLSVIG